jgi:phosphoglycolate phosphatase
VPPLPPIAGILFDKDGTLLDYATNWGPVNRRAATLAADGDPVLAARLLQLGGADPASGRVAEGSLLAAGTAAEIAAAWAAGGARLAAEALTRALDDLFIEAAGGFEPIADLPALFGRLRGRGLRLGVASSDNEQAIRRIAARFGIAPLLDFVAGYDSGFGGKPDPDMVHAFCRATGLAPTAVAVVGDNPQDLRMGRAAGAGRVIGVLTGTGSAETLAPLADLCLASIAEIEAALG